VHTSPALARRLAFFDLQDPMAARAYYSLALEAAQEAGDHLQAAAARLRRIHPCD
jgi:hypothetical protein